METDLDHDFDKDHDNDDDDDDNDDKDDEDHYNSYSVNFRASTSRFRMGVDLHNTYNMILIKMMIMMMMMIMMIMMIIAVIQSIFKLGPPNLAWKFTLTPHKNWQKFLKRGVAPRGRGTCQYTLL